MGDIKDLATNEIDSLIQEVQDLVSEIDKTHRYSMSLIYGLYNKVFETNETPQSCASCLIRKTKELKEWLSKQTTEVKKPKKKKQ